MELLIGICVFLAVSLLVIGINQWTGEGKQGISQRLESLTKTGGEEAQPKAMNSLEFDFNKMFSAVGKNFSSFSFTTALENDLDKADILLRVDEFMGLDVIITLIGGLLGLLLTNNPTYGIMGALLGAVIPIIFVKFKKSRRVALLSEEIGESLTGMSNSLRAGYSFQQAMDSVGKETKGPLGKEYRRTLREINLGVTTEQALQNLINRVQNEDLELMISSVLIQRSIGGNLAEMFDKIADTIRQRIRMKGEVRVLTAQGRVSSWIIGLMPVFLIMVISMINPGYLGFFFETTFGLALLATAVVSEVIGFIIIKKITDIEF